MREDKTRDGNIGISPNLAQVISAEKIRTGKFRLPKDQLLSSGGGAEVTTSDTVPGGFAIVHDDDLPF